jgi:hypothetical protein
VVWANDAVRSFQPMIDDSHKPFFFIPGLFGDSKI